MFIIKDINYFQPSTVVKNAILLKLKMLSWLFQSLDTERETEEEPDEGQQKPVKVKSDKPKPVSFSMSNRENMSSSTFKSLCQIQTRQT